ncbi:hypothetical protein M5K25_016924 [Dendrobium thyrsiflorum]|uniref:ATPase AAA-type core domain-containing protein n=1 Tax=Dendrobium thyrsiflorum TaxID=117978 RepID=A0ABD0USV7_DENTH
MQDPEKYVGESEQELDALTTKRGSMGCGTGPEPELDGADQRHGVYVIGATNRLEVIDPAILRPGRFGRLFYVPLPSTDERGLILKALARKKPVSPDFDYNAFTSREACKNLNGSDLAALGNPTMSIKFSSYLLSNSAELGSTLINPSNLFGFAKIRLLRRRSQEAELLDRT